MEARSKLRFICNVRGSDLVVPENNAQVLATSYVKKGNLLQAMPTQAELNEAYKQLGKRQVRDFKAARKLVRSVAVFADDDDVDTVTTHLTKKVTRRRRQQSDSEEYLPPKVKVEPDEEEADEDENEDENEDDEDEKDGQE